MFIELFVVLAFALGWLVLELVARRLDKRDQKPKDKDEAPGSPLSGSNSP